MSFLDPHLFIIETSTLRQILLPTTLCGSIFTSYLPALANNSAALDISIENQAVGSFLDPADSATLQQVESNVVNEVELEQPTATNNTSTSLISSENTTSTNHQSTNTSKKNAQ